MSNKPKPQNHKRKFMKALKFFTLAVIPHKEFSEIYSKVSPAFTIGKATAEIKEELHPEWHLYVGKALEVEQYFNQLFSTAMPVLQNMTITTEDGSNYQLVNIKYEKIRGYDGMRVRLMLTEY